MELQRIRNVFQATKYIELDKKSEEVSLFSRLFFIWIQKILKFGSNFKLEPEHTFPLPDKENVSSDNLSNYLENHNLFFAIILNNKAILTFSIFLSLLTVVLEFSGPVYMELLMDYIGQEEKPLKEGLILAGIFTLTSLVYPLICTQKNFFTELCAIRIRNSLFNLIYNKSLQSSNLSEELGINLLQVDVTKIYEFYWFLPYFISIPFQIGIAIYLIYKQVGNAVWIAIISILIAMFSNFLLRSTCSKSIDAIMKLRDERIQQSTQLLTNIKMIKAYSWEDYFFSKLTNIQEIEVSKMKSLNILYSCNLFYFWSLPSLVVVIVFAYYTVFMGQDLNSSKAFITLTTLFLLQVPLMGIPLAGTKCLQLLVSHKRMNKFIESNINAHVEVNKISGKIEFIDCSFAYGEKVVLSQISLVINPGEFVAVIGPVGSGKSSLLLSIMGELSLTSGKFRGDNSLAYTGSLDSWLFNGTIRENIIFGQDYNEDWYIKVLESCCLLQDLQSFTGGDKTEIGQRGVNLSGGQRSRICLARAVYSNKRVYLLDDPLSSVDNQVSSQILNQCFFGILKEKTRILVTHQRQHLKQIGKVISVENGNVTLKYDLNETNDEYFKVKDINLDLDGKNADKLMKDEDREVGEVDREIYKEYFRFSGGFKYLSLACICLGFWMLTRMSGDIILHKWTNHPSEVSFYLPLYIFLRLGGCIFIFLRSIILSVIMSPKISLNIHSQLIQGFLKAPINLFYDITPIGMLLNRLTKDINMIDDEISFTVGSVLANITSTLSCILMGLIYFPYLIVFVPVILVPGRIISKYYMKTSRELTRLESISRSPMLSHFGETLAGGKFIRCYKEVDTFIQKNQEKINQNFRLKYSKCGCEQWMRLYLGLLSSTFLSALFIFLILYRDSISSGIVGLTLTYMIPLPETISELLVSLTTAENDMVSVERLKSSLTLPQESSFSRTPDASLQSWPSAGSISFCKVVLRYRPNSEIVLNSISFNIKPGQKVGIAGRTGSGKSTLFLALLRIIEIESGNIYIDGVDTKSIGLRKLRQSIMLVPQDPMVFKGSLKDNIDPFGTVEPDQARLALEQVGFDLKNGFEVDVSAGNLSLGQRQLLSLSRALLSDARIVLFDEATASVDFDTDKKIQEVVRKRFGDRTVLTLAHRLESILGSDFVLVMDDGKVIESGRPCELLLVDSEFKKISNR